MKKTVLMRRGFPRAVPWPASPMLSEHAVQLKKSFSGAPAPRRFTYNAVIRSLLIVPQCFGPQPLLLLNRGGSCGL
jgi:hypothetical protein